MEHEGLVRPSSHRKLITRERGTRSGCRKNLVEAGVDENEKRPKLESFHPNDYPGSVLFWHGRENIRAWLWSLQCIMPPLLRSASLWYARVRYPLMAVVSRACSAHGTRLRMSHSVSRTGLALTQTHTRSASTGYIPS